MTKPHPDTLDPDIRFLLANERTLLAWIRTALAVVAGGLALTQLGRGPVQFTFGLSAILLGAMMAAVGFVRFRAAERAIRSAKLPAPGRGPAIQVIGVIVFALAVAAVELARM